MKNVQIIIYQSLKIRKNYEVTTIINTNNYRIQSG